MAGSNGLIRYFGGKVKIAPWIVAHLPPHRVYVEPFGGGAAVLLAKPRARVEVYNDLDDGLVNLFRVLRHPTQGEQLLRLVRLTPYARKEFEAAYEPTDDPVERARRLLVRSHLGHGGEATNGRRTGFRRASHRKEARSTHPALDWPRYPARLARLIARLAGVVVEHRPAIEVMAYYDAPDTATYLDPPYLVELLQNPYDRLYNHPLAPLGHEDLAAAASRCAGTVLVSGYHSPLYDRLYAGWQRHERRAVTTGGGRRTEVLWIKPAGHQIPCSGCSSP